MNCNDLVSDTIIRIKNALLTKSSFVCIPQTDLTLAIIKVLKQEGFIESFSFGFPIKKLVYVLVKLKYKGIKQAPIITNIKRISTPSSRIYFKVSKLEKLAGGVSVYILSTSQGILTDRLAKLKRVGGEVLFLISSFIFVLGWVSLCFIVFYESSFFNSSNL
uniref:Small ribosomal subunit protein uS8c n=1 Tax=Phacus orbicularis TaxID=158829 RepID=A0A182B0X4_9EUGL|nr:ribosomal protein S8 [Phacus orbicularis]